MDLIYILVSIVLVTSVVYIIIWAMVTQLTPVLGNVTTSQGVTAMTQISDQTSTALDYGFAITFFISILMAILFSVFIQTHPVMFFITIFLDIFIVFIAQIVKTVYVNILTIDIINGMDVYFPLTNWIVTNLVIVMVVLLAIQAIFMFSALRDGVL